MPNLRWQELLIIVALVLLLFGAKRLPDAARGLGRSLRIFKAETKGLVDGEEDDETAADAAAGSTAPAPAPPSAIESPPREAPLQTLVPSNTILVSVPRKPTTAKRPCGSSGAGERTTGGDAAYRTSA